MTTIVSSSIKNGDILLLRYGLWDRPMLPDDELIPLSADCTWKVPDSCQTAKALINKEGAPICLFDRLRGHIAFARKNGQDMLYFRPQYAFNHRIQSNEMR